MLKNSIIKAFPGTIISFVIAGAVGLFLVPVPSDAVGNAISSGISGAMGALFSTVIAFLCYFKKGKE